MNNKIEMIPIDQIRVINPRHRDRRKFELLVQSIQNLGLKKPIQVSLRSMKDGEEPGYDLVCGQGRIEAFKVLHHTVIPAEVKQISKEERLLRSLVENMARRFPAPLDLIKEIERLKGEQYTNSAIAKKLDISENMVGGLIALNNAGEERLLDAALRGKVPLGVAMEIAKADSIEMQKELLKAYEEKQLNKTSIRAVRTLMQQRNTLGKNRRTALDLKRTKVGSDSLVTAYKRETLRKKQLVRKARICEAKLFFLVTAFKNLLCDDNFINLLRAEDLPTMPKYLSDKLSSNLEVAA